MRRSTAVPVLLALALVGFDALAQPKVDARLLEGARHFRDGRFDAALVEFKVAHTLGARGEVSWYLAATLSRLGRAEESLEAFDRARDEDPHGADPLLVWYEAIACHDARLLVCTDTLLERIGEQAGPRISELAAALRAKVRPLLEQEPPASAIDALLTRGDAARKSGRALLARRYFLEAQAQGERRADRHRVDEAVARLGTSLHAEPVR